MKKEEQIAKQVNDWYEEYRKEKRPHGFTEPIEILNWLAEKVVNKISVNLPVMRSVCSRHEFENGQHTRDTCANCGQSIYE